MRAFVTGSTGLLGANLVRALLERGDSVVALVRSPAKARRVLPHADITVAEGDVTDQVSYLEALSGCDVVFHTAAYFRESFMPGKHAQALRAVNVDATVALLQASFAHGIHKVVYVSSDGVIGSPLGGGAGTETTPPDRFSLQNAYFRSKVEAERAILAWSESHPLPVVQILPGWMFGPYDDAPTSGGAFVRDFLDKKIPGVIDGGQCVVDARDVVRAMLVTAERVERSERYIVSGNYASIELLLQTLSEVSGVTAPARRLATPIVRIAAWAAELQASLTGRPATLTRAGLEMILPKRETARQKRYASSASASDH